MSGQATSAEFEEYMARIAARRAGVVEAPIKIPRQKRFEGPVAAKKQTARIESMLLREWRGPALKSEHIFHPTRKWRFEGKHSRAKRRRMALTADGTPLPEHVQVFIPGDPQTKPRQTRSDVWKKRPCVVAYRAWADKARECAGETLPPAHRVKTLRIIAHFKIPASRHDVGDGDEYRQAPDWDNIGKAVVTIAKLAGATQGEMF